MSDCFWTDFVGCAEDCGGESPPAGPGVAYIPGQTGGGPTVAVKFVLQGASVLNAVLTAIEIRWEGPDADFNGCNLGPTTPVYSSGGPLPLFLSGGGEAVIGFSIGATGETGGVMRADLPDFVAGTVPVGYAGGWYASFTITDLDTGREYVGTGSYNTCY